jgi:hypothetical protein
MEWISVEERLPLDGQIVIICDVIKNITYEAMFAKQSKRFYCGHTQGNFYSLDVITHWTPSLEPPK